MKYIYQLLLTSGLFITSCSSPLQHFDKVQSDKRLSKTETRNFGGGKSETQWWYFDCFLENGSVLVFIFTPYQWWSEAEKMPTHKALLYLSYMDPQGKVFTESKTFETGEVGYSVTGIKCPYFELNTAHGKKAREYSIHFLLDSIQGSATIRSGISAFSPFPVGEMGPFMNKHIFKRPAKKATFRYAAMVPQGRISCDLKIQGKPVTMAGKAYHEQGFFSGSAAQMGSGWEWFHFVSKNVNLFGTPEAFFCFEKNGERIAGALNIFDKGCLFSNPVYALSPNNFLVGGKLAFVSNKLRFEVNPTGELVSQLICIPSFDTDQVWGTVSQPSTIHYTYKGKEYKEEGKLLIETCRMGIKKQLP